MSGSILTRMVTGNINRLIKRVENIEVLETKKEACLGLMRATLYAKSHHISLGRMIAEEVLDCGNFVSGPPYKCEKRDEI